MGWPLDICLASPGLPHDGGTLLERSLGGSETAAICIARALARRGHHVTVFSPCQGGLWDEVEYRPLDGWGPYVTGNRHDVTISSRDVGALAVPIEHSKIKVLWCHDLARRANRDAVAGLLWQLDHVYVLSDYQHRQYQLALQGVPDDVYRVTRNGINVADFPGLRGARDRTKILYASRPERGLENALAIMDHVRRRDPNIWLGVCGYDNTTPQMRPYYEALWARARTMPNVRILGFLTKKQWYKELETAAALIYPGVPGEFREISWIAGMEAMAAACPIIAVKRGAVPETCGTEAAIYPAADLVTEDEGNPHDERYRDAFAGAIVGLLKDDVHWKAVSRAGRKRALQLDWSLVAEQWESWWFADLTARRRNDPNRIMAAMEAQGEREGMAWLTNQQ